MTADALLTLSAWFSPAYPVGAYSYSHGLETAIADGAVAGPETLSAWIADSMTWGGGRNDAILLARAYEAPEDAAIAELAEALCPSAERRTETLAQGAAFAETTAAAWGWDQDQGQDQDQGAAPSPPAPAAYPVAAGRAAAAHGLPLEDAAAAYLLAFAANLVSAGVRLIPIGQTDGQRVLAGLAPLCRRIAQEAIVAPLDALGSAALGAEIASMRHETQPIRLFRS